MSTSQTDEPPPGALLAEARAEAMDELDTFRRYCAGRDRCRVGFDEALEYSGDTARMRAKWLHRLPNDYDFSTNTYRWALSAAQRATLPPPIAAPEPELRNTSRAYPFKLWPELSAAERARRKHT